MKYAYPAVFAPDENQIAVHFYDRPDWLTCGEKLPDAIEMAEDLLASELLRAEQTSQKLPPSTPLDKVLLTYEQTVRMIEVDTEVYAAKLAAQRQREELAMSENPLKALRELKDWSIKDFADFLGAPYRTVQDWNSGAKSPPKWVIDLIIFKVQNDS